MKSFAFLAASGAALVAAGPIQAPNVVRAVETDWITETVVVTVTEGSAPPATSVSVAPTGGAFIEGIHTQQPRPHYSHGHSHHHLHQHPTYAVPSAPESTSEAPIIETTYWIAPSATLFPPLPPTTFSSVATTSVIISHAPPPSSSTPAPPTSTLVTSTYEAPPPSSSAPAPVSTSAPSTYQSTILDHHNMHRSNHSAPDLEWDNLLAVYAKTIADTCVFAHDMTQGGGGYGQNLAMWGSSDEVNDLVNDAAGAAITDQWYNCEMENWQFYGDSNPPSSSDFEGFGHFTQLVWKDSQKVGCATVLCPSGTMNSMNSLYTVCNYSPPGNFGGEYNVNVLPPLGNPIETASI